MRLGGASDRRSRRGSTHERNEARAQRLRIHTRRYQRRTCMRRALPGPDRNVACCAVVPGEQIILERANALKHLSSASEGGSSQSDTVSSLHASMSGPWASLQGDGVRQTPAPATTYCIAQHMSSQDELIAIPLMCRHNCEAALTGHGHGMTDSPKPVRKARLLLSPCLSASFSYHSPFTRLRKACSGVTCRLERIRMCSTSAN